MRGLYIHIPYCKSKCGYCDFTSYTGKEDTINAYIAALAEEAEEYEGEEADTVFIGGGTPSLLSPAQVEALFSGIRKHLSLSPEAEISIETNPNSLSQEKAEAYREAGINRVSLGLQAVQDELLKKIGRAHVYRDFLNALGHLISCGIKNINADLMYSLPGQSVEQVRESALEVSRLPVTHISAYALKLEPGVPMYGAVQPSEETDREMYDALRETLGDAGFYRYEISNFSKPGCQCRHNLKYWNVEEYIGLGVSAHSFYRGKRYSNTTCLAKYLAGGGRRLNMEEADPLEEKLMLKTRLQAGVPLLELPDTEAFRSRLLELEKGGLCTLNGNLTLTDRGFDLHDFVVLKLISGL